MTRRHRGAEEDGRPGTPLGEVIPVSDPVIELEPTSNRVDCFGIYGVAREVHAITGSRWPRRPGTRTRRRPARAGRGLRLGDRRGSGLCPRFSARVFTDVQIGPSPLWLKARLIGAGMRPINNVVDITNYVMLMTAQPLHAFDLDKVPDGALIVRTAKQGEKMTTLDGVERTFDEDAVLVCDRNGPSGIAGIMGGEVSEVSDDTTRVLLEVATWNGVNILRTSRKLGLRTDASNRFEKQLHPELALRGQRIASQLMVELCGAKLVPGRSTRPPTCRSRTGSGSGTSRVARLLGMEITPEQCVEYLERLEFEVDGGEGDDLEATVPFHRHYDVTREVDLIEEVGRIHGYAEESARHAALDERPGRTADPRAAAAAPGGGRNAGSGLRRGRQPEPHRPRHARQAANPGWGPQGRADSGLQPAVGRALGGADRPARLPAGCRGLQPRSRRRAGRALRVRSRLPARG